MKSCWSLNWASRVHPLTISSHRTRQAQRLSGAFDDIFICTDVRFQGPVVTSSHEAKLNLAWSVHWLDFKIFKSTKPIVVTWLIA